ncbi:MAG: hypothetical protein M9921_00520 [Fimbriimonadaceae bacterium]|nr:hypothetical protein [Chthonomonadaceae bacterium]MCO5295317.1 hypothetical protein [Fimbriimonadaceae bacterium]
MKTGLGIALFAACVFAQAQDLNQKVTYTGPAAPTKVLLEQLGKQTGLLLGTSPQTAGEVLVVHATDVPLADLLKRIAEATGAEWKEETGGYRLVRPEIVARDQLRAEIAERAKGVEAAVRRMVAPLEKAPTFDEASARTLAEEARKNQNGAVLDFGNGNFGSNGFRIQGASASQSPAQRALLRLMDDIPASTLAAIQPGSRIVFASSANRMQRAMGPKSGGILNLFVQEQNTWARALADTPREVPPDNTRMIFLGGPDLSSKTIDRLGKALLVVHRTGDGPELTVEFKAADSKGQIVSRANVVLVPQESAVQGPVAAGKPIELSQTAQEYAELMGGKAAQSGMLQTVTIRLAVGGSALSWSGNPESVPPVPESWKERLANPDRYEPLEFVSGEAFRAAAAAESRNLVACLPDSGLIPTCSRLGNAKLTPAQFLGFAQSRLDLKVDRPDEWLLVSPRYATEARASHIDRGALGALLRLTLKNGYARLDDMAAYALKQSDDLPGSSFDERTLLLLSPETGRDFQANAADRRLMLKLFGTLSPTQRAALARGGTLPLGSLSAAQAEWVRSMVYDSLSGPDIQLPPSEPQPAPPAQEEQSIVMVAAVAGGQRGGRPFLGGLRPETTLLEERTEALPLGVPTSGQLAVTIRSNSGVRGTRADGTDARFMSADELAGELAGDSMPGGASPSAGEAGPYTLFRPATLSQYGFQFALSPNARLARELRDAMLMPGGATGLDGLPPAFRAEVQRARAQLERAMQRMQSGPGPGRRRGGPPPPR